MKQCPEILRLDYDIANAVVKSSPKGFAALDKKLQKNGQLACQAVSSNPINIEIVFKIQENSNKKQVCVAIVKNDGMFLKNISEKLKNSYSVVIAAVKQNGLAL